MKIRQSGKLLRRCVTCATSGRPVRSLVAAVEGRQTFRCTNYPYNVCILVSNGTHLMRGSLIRNECLSF